MGVLLDSGVLIELERRSPMLASLAIERADETFYLSVISASELLHGIHRAEDLAIRMRRSAFVEAILDRFPLLPVESAFATYASYLGTRPEVNWA